MPFAPRPLTLHYLAEGDWVLSTCFNCSWQTSCLEILFRQAEMRTCYSGFLRGHVARSPARLRHCVAHYYHRRKASAHCDREKPRSRPRGRPLFLGFLFLFLVCCCFFVCGFLFCCVC